MTLLVNVDAGELEDEPAELAALADVLHVACGGHAGDATSMLRTLRRIARAGSAAGAHPSYPDREGFGRRAVALDRTVIVDQVRAQCLTLRRHAEAVGLRLTSMKPHGALYHDAARDPELAHGLVGVTREVLGAETAIVGPPRGALRAAAESDRLRYLAEGFADRGYGPDGGLLPRTAEGALVTDPGRALTQALELRATGAFDTLCVHGDNPGALAILRALRAGLA